MHRRELLFASGAAALGRPQLAALQVGRPAPETDRKIRLGIVGGGFGSQFHFHEHPNCIVTAVTDLRAGRRAKLQQVYRCDTAYDSLDQMLAKEKRLDAVAIFSGALDHVRHVEACMTRGLHVYCAVPTCQSLDEAARLAAIVEKTGLTYMLGETSFYRSGCIHARHLNSTGAIGEIFYTEISYYHDRGDLKELVENRKTRFYEPDGSKSWRWGLAPMHYPTHCTGFVVGVTNERIRSVSALGWGSKHPYLDNRYRNPYWNESALMETSQGHMVRCNVFWLVGEDGEKANWYGSNGTLYMANEGRHGDVYSARLEKAKPVKYPDYLQDPMIPASMRHASGHGGSHVFLSAEFINCLLEKRKPFIDVYKAIAMMAPGLVAHQSALKGGERLKVPSFDPA